MYYCIEAHIVYNRIPVKKLNRETKINLYNLDHNIYDVVVEHNILGIRNYIIYRYNRNQKLSFERVCSGFPVILRPHRGLSLYCPKVNLVS